MVKGAPGFECQTGGPGGGEAFDGLKKFTKIRSKFYFGSPMTTGGCTGHRDRRSASFEDLSALCQAKKVESICHCVPLSNIIARYFNSKDKGSSRTRWLTDQIKYDATTITRCPECGEDINVGTVGPASFSQHTGKSKWKRMQKERRNSRKKERCEHCSTSISSRTCLPNSRHDRTVRLQLWVSSSGSGVGCWFNHCFTMWIWRLRNIMHHG